MGRHAFWDMSSRKARLPGFQRPTSTCDAELAKILRKPGVFFLVVMARPKFVSPPQGEVPVHAESIFGNGLSQFTVASAHSAPGALASSNARRSDAAALASLEEQ